MSKEILYGINPVYETLMAGRRNVFKIFITHGKISKRLEQILALAGASNIPVERVKGSDLKMISGTDYHQGVCAETGPYPFVDFSEMLVGGSGSESKPFLLLLDSIVDPNNLGALVRTAVCVGMSGVIIPKDRSVSPTPTVSKSSAGALEHVRLSRVTNMANTIKRLKKDGLWIAGIDRTADESIFTCDMNIFNGVVIGGEGKGIRPLVKKHCDKLLSIPQTGLIDSLNASVAGAVVMYEAFRQRLLLPKGKKGREKRKEGKENRG
ncbi:MAG: 23S rRNA (guanosine(2251)-2'-O)-methyltransferase RlmB [Desulfobacterales bacterium]|jgi:23S rRNA (guanosine2251-2'-O)-methyltransferase|nr:23S rRNA (guanosine(2251)-2'-O)-methyltransferase RlmB [Desulfobacterales bacterium]